MTMKSREADGVSRPALVTRAGGSPLRITTTAVWSGAAFRRARRITYLFTGSPITRITGESAMITGHMAREIAVRVTRPGCLINPG